ncbi:phage tail tube protein [Haloarcula argentinensis]|uniref:Phage tail tube protein n=1 Tax=Haloarcula argentinensis TaxID=43776 RepID=A0ABU2F718_HALAR|nr:phage tail tube protein [Haloarcula argentinensis]MDS0256028.1 phage tail tube protein [Haloarcula argentinensis]
MTGAGSGSLAFGKEQSFKGSLVTDTNSDPQYWQFGRNETITELSLDNQLQRLNEAGAVESVESVKQNFEGAFGVEAAISADTFDDVEDLVFNDGGTQFTHGRPNSGRIYAGVDYLDGTSERELVGCIPVDFTPVSYEQGGMTTFSISFLYATENLDTSITPSNVTAVTGGTSAASHAVTVDIDGTTITKLQSAEISISNIARFQYGSVSPEPIDAVIEKPETEVTTEAIFSGPSRLEYALGAADATSPQDRLVSVPGTIDITVDGTPVSTYNFSALTVATEAWNSVISSDDTTESISWNADGDPAVSIA